MDIALHAPVIGLDGELGRVENVIVNVVAGRITTLVVRAAESPNAERLVPEKFVESAEKGQVVLRLSKKDFHKLKPFIQEDYLPPNMFMHMAQEEHETLPLAPASWTVEREAIPDGAVALRRHAAVMATDGKAGKVDEYLVERRTGRITHLVMVEGHLWGKRTIEIPVSLVDRYEDNAVHLSIDKKTVELLPVVTG